MYDKKDIALRVQVDTIGCPCASRVRVFFLCTALLLNDGTERWKSTTRQRRGEPWPGSADAQSPRSEVSSSKRSQRSKSLSVVRGCDCDMLDTYSNYSEDCIYQERQIERAAQYQFQRRERRGELVFCSVLEQQHAVDALQRYPATPATALRLRFWIPRDLRPS